MPVAPRLLFVHAHPDDESSKGAATAARYADEGAEVVLVTATDGAAGDILNPSYPPLEPHEMGPVRERELARAIDIIGFTRVHLLGYPDSGLPEDLADIPDGCFADLPVDGPAARLAAVLREERPHVVVTYPPDGGYPHPDHIRVHQVTMLAVELAADAADAVAGWQVPRTTFGTGFPRARLEAIHAEMTARGLDSPYDEWLADRTPRDADREPDIVVDVADWLDRRDAALIAHATQIDPDGQWFSIPREVEKAAFPWETYVILDGAPAPTGATDLFAGLALDE
jgi:mycothiol S-conjugate amidase